MPTKPTRQRLLVLFVVCLVYFITYLDRVNVSVAAPLLMQEFGISKAQLGAVFSAFMVGYVLFQIPVGMLGDKYGPRIVLTGLVVVWSFFTFAITLAWSFSSLIVLRFLFGIGEAGAFTIATRAFSAWIPKTERGFAQGITHAFARFGGAVTPLIMAPIVFALGWREAFYICTGVGIVWAIFWFYWYRDTPQEFNARWNNKVNQAEIDLINDGRVVAKKGQKLPIKALFKSKNAWAVCAAYFCYNFNLWIFLTWLPTYLVDARGFTIVKMGIFASIPLLAGTIGDTLGGYLSDLLWKKTGKGNFSRRIVAIVGLLIAACFMIPGAMTESPYMAIFFLACSLFGLEMAVGVYWAVCLDIGEQYSGTVSSMMNCFGNIGSILSPFLFGVIVQYTGSWVYPFILASSLLVVGSVIWLFIKPEYSVNEELGLN